MYIYIYIYCFICLYVVILYIYTLYYIIIVGVCVCVYIYIYIHIYNDMLSLPVRRRLLQRKPSTLIDACTLGCCGTCPVHMRRFDSHSSIIIIVRTYCDMRMHACTQCMHAVHARSACTQCMHTMHACMHAYMQTCIHAHMPTCLSTHLPTYRRKCRQTDTHTH
jgi:hypothetical protein